MGKKLFAALACLLISIFVISPGYADSQHWKIGHVRPPGSAIDKDIHALVEQIKTETNGAILIDIYPANKLGDYSMVQERVSFGEVEMYAGPFGTAIDKRLALAFTPYLVSTWDEARKVYSRDSILFKQIAALLEPHNIKLIGGWPVYFGGMALTEKPSKPEDLETSKQMIIRIPPIRCFEMTAKELGYTPYPITWTYAVMGLKTGMVKGILGGGAEGYLGLKGMIKYYLPINDHFEYWFVYMNLERWNKLPQKDKATIAGATALMEVRRYANAQADEVASLEKLKNQGIQIIEFDEQQIAAMKSKVRKNVWPLMRREIGDIFDKVVNAQVP